MHFPRVAVPALLPILICACIYDGQYMIRGRVGGQAATGVEVIEGASVIVTASGHRYTQPAWVGRDGTFQGTYRFGGVGFLFFLPGDGEPHVEFSAPGYHVVRVKLRSDEAPDGVTRRECVPPGPGTYCLDVVLAPLSRAHANERER